MQINTLQGLHFSAEEMEGADEENLLENEEKNEKEEEKVLPPQKNNLFNYFSRKQVSNEKGPPVVEQMSKKGETSISVSEETTKSRQGTSFQYQKSHLDLVV